jgi:hypothetical protein
MQSVVHDEEPSDAVSPDQKVIVKRNLYPSVP